MADDAKRLTTNVAGNFFVDSTCIDCDTCRQLAPDTFAEVGEYSAVVRQPATEEQVHRAYQALLACPTGSIGAERTDGSRLRAARASFPMRLDEDVYYCGFNSEKSFGANSFFIRHPHGNWMIDSPRYAKPLVDWIDAQGGLRHVFLTHEDDVADAARYARRFGAERIVHRDDAHAVPDAERVIGGREAAALAPSFVAVPVPGHTAGSMALLCRDTFLFTGDHLWWDPASRSLEAPSRLVWDHDALIQSILALTGYRFEWVLAGHGDRVRLPVAEMHRQLIALAARRQVPATP